FRHPCQPDHHRRAAARRLRKPAGTTGVQGMSRRTLLVMAGGTGGHIFPALAVARAVRERGWDVVWLGARGAMETRIVPQHDIPLETLAIGGVRGKGILTKLLQPWVQLRALCG